MKNQLILSVLLVAAVCQAVAQHQGKNVFQKTAPVLEPTGKAVVRINGSVLTDRDLLREMYAIFPYAKQHNGTFPQAMEPDIRRGALKMIEFEELVYQEALRRKMTVPPARLNQAEAQFSHQFHTPEQYETYLMSECQGQRKVLRAKIRRSLLIEEILKGEVTDRSIASLAATRIYFQQHQEKFRIPESFSIQTISIVPPKSDVEQMKQGRKKADNALIQARATQTYEQFGMLAEQISEDDYRVVMGDHRLVEGFRLPPQVLNAVKKMKVGEISDVIQVENVYTIVRLNKHLPAGLQNFADIKDSLRLYLQKQNVEKLRAGLNTRLRKTARIEEL